MSESPMSESKGLTPEIMLKMKGEVIPFIPHAKDLGLTIVDAAVAECWLSMAYDERLIGDPETGVLHGGVITALLDTACGFAAQLGLTRRISIATLDLRIDYMKAATPRLTVMAHAHCYKVTSHIAFVRGTAYHDDESDPIATCVGTFMIGSNRTNKSGVLAMVDAAEKEQAQNG